MKSMSQAAVAALAASSAVSSCHAMPNKKEQRHTVIAKGMALPGVGRARQQGRKDPSYRHQFSPHNKRRDTTRPTSSSSSPPVLSGNGKEVDSAAQQHRRGNGNTCCGLTPGRRSTEVPSKKTKAADVSMSRSAPTDMRSARLDSERLLNQMGMDVTEDDYCIEGEYSYDCNYNHRLERAYEEFGVERKLVELRRHPQQDKRKEVTFDIDSSNPDRRDSYHVRGKLSNQSKVLKALSVLSGKRSKVPDQIALTASEDSAVSDVDCQMTPENMQLLHKWQSARIQTTKLLRRKKVEDFLSNTSSGGDKTAPMDNRKSHRRGVSF